MTEQLKTAWSNHKANGGMSATSTNNTIGIAAGISSIISAMIQQFGLMEGAALTTLAAGMTAVFSWLLPTKPPWKK